MGEMLPAGRVVKLFGVKGEVTVELYDAFPDNFDLEEPVFVTIDSLPVPLYFEQFRRRGRTGAVAVFADMDTSRRAAELTGKTFCLNCSTPNTGSEQDGLQELIGFSAMLAEGISGRITDFIGSGLNPLFEVETADGEKILIPAVEEFIAGADFESRTIEFSLPEGLLEINS